MRFDMQCKVLIIYSSRPLICCSYFCLHQRLVCGGSYQGTLHQLIHRPETRVQRQTPTTRLGQQLLLPTLCTASRDLIAPLLGVLNRHPSLEHSGNLGRVRCPGT